MDSWTSGGQFAVQCITACRLSGAARNLGKEERTQDHAAAAAAAATPGIHSGRCTPPEMPGVSIAGIR